MRKMILKALVVILGGLMAGGSFLSKPLSADTKTDVILSRDVQGVDTTRTVDVGEYESLSVQVAYDTGSITTDTVSDGAKSTMKITVANVGSLQGKVAASSITVVSPLTAGTGVTVTIDGYPFKEGTNWTGTTFTTQTAKNLQTVIDAYGSFDASVSSNVVFASWTVVGVGGNSKAITTSNSNKVHVQGPTLSGGQDHAYFCFNGTCLTEGTEWNIGSSSAITTRNMSDAVLSNSAISAVIVSTPGGGSSAGVLWSTSTLTGINQYTVSVSTPAFVLSSPYFSGGSATDISVADDEITQVSHGYSTGLDLLFRKVSGTTPTGLTAEATYYAIRTGVNSYKLAGASTAAVAGTAVNITATTGSGSFSLIPLAKSGSAVFDFSASNDNTNWIDLAISSTTAANSGTFASNLAAYAYRYIKMTFTAPTTGGLDIQAILSGRLHR
jgi:hypothetical protein